MLLPLYPLFSAILCVVLLSLAAPAAAQGVVNGDFATGDFSGWSLDTDGSPGGASDFSVVGAPGSRAARIEADYFATPGDITSVPSNGVFLANTLHQAVDTTTTGDLALVFRWSFGGEDGDPAAGETFLVGFGDGSGALYGADGRPGHVLAPTTSYDHGTVVVPLDPASFNNVPGWTLEFQLGVGVDPALYRPNALGSFVEIEDVRLPEPGRAAGLGLGLAALAGLHGWRRRRARGWAALAAAGVALLGSSAASAQQGWTDVSASVDVAQTLPEFDRVNSRLASHVTLTNTSGSALPARLRLVVDATLPVSNEDGRTGAYEPYFDVPALAAGESRSVRVGFERVRAPLAYSVRLERLAPSSGALTIVTAPFLTMDPTGQTPLAGLITAETNIAARARLTVSGNAEVFTVEFPEFQTQHELPLLGLKASTLYTVLVEFIDQNGLTITSGTPLFATTGPLPATFPQVTVFESQPARMEPGYTLVDKYTSTIPAAQYISIFDSGGEVVWLGTFGGLDVEQSANGNLNLGPATTAVETTMLGQNVSAVPLNAGMSIHHDLFRTVYGTFLSLGRVIVTEPNYPTSETDPNAPTAQSDLLDEPPIEFDPAGNLLNVWPLSTRIDTTRIGYNAFGTTGQGGARDWVHANAVTHDPRDDSLLISLRHQDAIVKLSRYSGNLVWILAPHANWKAQHQPFLLQPVGSPFEWSYHQHAIEVTPSGTYMLFDNGNLRASPFDGNPTTSDAQNYSRAVEYAIDEDTMEIQQVWEWGGNVADPIYSYFISDADAQPETGNVLVNFGGHEWYDNQPISSQGWGRRAIRIVEVTRDTPAEKVFDMLMYLPGTTATVYAYRAERIPSLYPPNVIVTHGP